MSKLSRDLLLKRETIEVAKNFTGEKKLPSDTTHLKCEIGKEQGIVKHHEGVFVPE